MNYDQIKQLETDYLVPNYDPMPVVFVRGHDVWLYDDKSNRYLDMMSAYSAVSQGHCHPRLLKAFMAQATKLTLTSRAFRSETLGPLAQKLCQMSGFSKMLPMNTGAEAVETAFMLARKWAYKVKQVPQEYAGIVVCENNFHGRTMTAVSLSTEPQYREAKGPFIPNINKVPFNDLAALKGAVNEWTAAFIVEPVQGEGGIIVPDKDYLDEAYAICQDKGALLIVDEVQTGLGRTGKMFAFQHSLCQPDGMMLGKALSGGLFPISCFLTTDEVASAIKPGDHGSTFAGSPIAGAVGLEALAIIEESGLVDASAVLGEYFLRQLKEIKHPLIKDVRGKGLLIGIELDTTQVSARTVCEVLLRNHIVSKDTHGKVLRFAPPLTATKQHIDYAIQQIVRTLEQVQYWLDTGGVNTSWMGSNGNS